MKKSCNITGIFINNRAGENGGALYLRDIVNYNLKGNFTNNSAKNGGAAYLDSVFVIPTFSVDGIFDSNDAAFGGAVRVPGYAAKRILPLHQNQRNGARV